MFKIDYISEPELMFAEKKESLNPTVGLIKYGPRFSSKDEKQHKWAKVGIIGSSKSISIVTSFLEDMRYQIAPKKICPWSIPFPGLYEDSPLKFSISLSDEWQQRFNSEEIEEIKSLKNKNERIEKVLQLIDNKMKIIYEKSTPPDIIIISLPEDIECLCVDARMENPLIKLKNEDDFHSRIKVDGMKYKMATQLIRPRTLMLKGTQEKSIVAWNLAVGLLYKSQKGYPWKLTHLEDNTCYVGISFFKERITGKRNMGASLAQLFIDTGESFILRGDSFEWNNSTSPNSPHLSKENAKKIIEMVLKQYQDVRKRLPDRLVIHKSSNYWDDEFEGFVEASKGIEIKDFVTLQPTDISFYRDDMYPVMRGTLVYSPIENECYLYTAGFAPCLKTYPSIGIPKPLMVRTKIADSSMKKICSEILAFTKLDWNNTFLYRKDPVTISVSRKVGKILAESEAKKIQIDPHYYYYM